MSIEMSDSSDLNSIRYKLNNMILLNWPYNIKSVAFSNWKLDAYAYTAITNE